MLWLYILGGIAAFLLLLALIPLGAVCRFSTESDQTVTLYGKIGPVRFLLFPRPAKRPNLKKYRISRLRKEAKKQKKPKKPKKSRAKSPEKAGEAKPKPKRSPIRTLKLVRRIASAALTRFGRYLRVRVRFFTVRIAADEAAKTAVLYGSVIAAAETFWNSVKDTAAFSRVKKSDFSFFADFSRSSTSAEGEILFSIRVWQVLALAVAAGGAYLRESAKQ